MSDEVMTALRQISGDIGELNGSMKALNSWLEQHVKDDEKVRADVLKLQLDQATNKGAAKVWTLVGSGVGAVLGSAVAVAAAWLGKHQ